MSRKRRPVLVDRFQPRRDVLLFDRYEFAMLPLQERADPLLLCGIHLAALSDLERQQLVCDGANRRRRRQAN